MSNNELVHYGVLGMKWGKRRSSTQSAGNGSRNSSATQKKKTAKDMSDDDLTSNVRRMNLEKQYNKLSKESTHMSKTEKTKKVVDATSSLVNQAKKLSQDSTPPKKEKLDLSKMTDRELRDRINRTNLERQYNDMFASPAAVSKGRQYASDILNVAGTTLTIGSSALGIALAIKELRG